MKSILQEGKECYVCRSPKVHEHHIFPGSKRNASERNGLKVYLCQEHHTGPRGAHFNSDFALRLKQTAQRKYEQTHTRDDFMKEIGRNYL